MSWVLGQNLFSSRTHVGAMESRCSVAEVYSLRPYLPVLEPLLLMSPLVQVVSPVLESAPSYAHVVASAATRNLRSPAMEKGSFIVHALAVASAGSMGSQSKFPRYACPVAGIDRFKGRRKDEMVPHICLYLSCFCFDIPFVVLRTGCLHLFMVISRASSGNDWVSSSTILFVCQSPDYSCR
ncbi:UNVERIFIED_CONTAM: hypothetical protein Slati_4606500 [Sesamum latifolium]|uniref:Uncharacterized protein n=1 Tax=Sesamum latifolium TaxID=2727402 RepID=A0AAW2S1T4_9LAMI